MSYHWLHRVFPSELAAEGGAIVARRTKTGLVTFAELIRESIKLQIRDFLEHFELNHPDEHLYALLVDVPAQGDAANVIAASTESFERFLGRGRRRKRETSASLDQRRDQLRWQVPGEEEFWYWCDCPSNHGTNHVIQLALDRDAVEMCDGQVKKLARAALKALEREEAFGGGETRERLFVGVTCVEEDFEWALRGAKSCNPPAVLERVRQELARAALAEDEE
jgi:hypothetical protein